MLPVVRAVFFVARDERAVMTLAKNSTLQRFGLAELRVVTQLS
jgi:hypothetical protein